MSLFRVVLHASQSLCHGLNIFIILTNKHVLRKRQKQVYDRRADSSE